MNIADFDVLIESDLNAHIKDLRAKKADEYATNADTLLNSTGPARSWGSRRRNTASS